MQITTCIALRSTSATEPWQRFSRVSSLRLEDDAPEETKIRELEKEIVKEHNKDKPVDSLVKERKQTYDKWISRLNREIADASRDQRNRDELKRQRERAIRDYG